ncbi:two-component system sensor protein [Stenotrophomonas maltophilia SKK35]|nr:two-component system sensor protein [Stenotrophomonas maltophilia SKK35]
MPPTSPYTRPCLAYTAGSSDGNTRVVSSWILLLVSVAYAALLFGVAWWGDRRPMYPDRPWLRPVVSS